MPARMPALFLPIACLSILLFVPTVPAQEVDDPQRASLPSRPERPVLDQGDLLSADETHRLGRKLTAFTDTATTAVVVLTVPHLSGVPIGDYAGAVGQAWGIGRGDMRNGIVLLISRDDRSLFVETEYGTDGVLSEAVADRILEQIIVPAFRQQQFYAGLDQGTDALLQAATGDRNSPPAALASSAGGLPLTVFLPLGIFLYCVIALFFRGGQKAVPRRSPARYGDRPVTIRSGERRRDDRRSGGAPELGELESGNFDGGGAGGSW